MTRTFTVNQAVDYIHEHSREIADIMLEEAPDYKDNRPSYICPVCANGAGEKGTGVPFVPNTYNLKCFGECQEYGDIIHFIGLQQGLDNEKDFVKILNIIGQEMDFSIQKENDFKEKKPNIGYKTLDNYVYKAKDGTPIYKKLRQMTFDKDTGEVIKEKHFSQFCIDKNKKLNELPEEYQGLLYNQDLIEKWKNEDDFIYLVEGEKDVNTLIQLGLKATTVNNSKIYLDNFRGINKLIMIPDNDQAGYSKVENYYSKIKDIIPEIKILKWDKETPEKFDSTDLIELESFDKSQFEAFVFPRLETGTEFIEQLRELKDQEQEDDLRNLKEEAIKERLQETKRSGSIDPKSLENIKGVLCSRSLLESPNIGKYSKARDIAIVNGLNYYYIELEDKHYIDYGNGLLLETNTSEFQKYIIGLCETVFDQVFTIQDIKQATGSINSYIARYGERKDIRLRTAYNQQDDSIYIDLCSKANEVIQINADGFKVIPMVECPIIFKRDKEMAELPKPIYRPDQQDYKLLQKYLNYANEDDFKIITSFLLASNAPVINQPILSVTGEAGSGKTTLMTVLSELIDPHKTSNKKTDQVVKVKRQFSSDEYAVLKQNSYLLPIDNLSGISGDLSDAICMTVTGGSVKGRKLYSDGEHITLSLSGVVILNGINEMIKKPDLVNRSLFVDLPQIKADKRKELELWSDFEKDKPYILGSLYNAIATGFKNRKMIVESPEKDYRLTGFREFIAKCTPALNWEVQEWNEAIVKNMSEAIEKSIETNPFIDSVITLLRQNSKEYSVINWIGDGQDLIDTIVYMNNRAIDYDDYVFPKARNVTNRLKQEASVLRQYDIEVITGNPKLRTKSKKYIHLRFNSGKAKSTNYPEALLYKGRNYVNTSTYVNNDSYVDKEVIKIKENLQKVFSKAYYDEFIFVEIQKNDEDNEINDKVIFKTFS